MKKRILFVAAFVALALALSLSLTACGGGGLSKGKVEKAYKDAGYTCVAGSANGVWSVTATKGADTVTVVCFKNKDLADAYAELTGVGGVKVEKSGKVVAVALTTAALEPFKSLL